MFWIALILAVFPQAKVDKVCLENRERKVVLDTRKHVAQKTLPIGRCKRHIPKGRGFFTETPVFSGNVGVQYIEPLNKKDDLYIGTGDTFLIDTNYVQNGNIIIYGDGVLIVDSAKLSLSGHLVAANQGQAIFRDNAHLHFNQYYVGQYYVWLVDTSKFEAADATIDANGVMHYAQIHDNCTYIAKRTTFPDWTFRKVFDRSTLILEDVYHVGDLMVDDSCFVHFTRCDTLMHWLETPDGSVIDIQFPDPDAVSHFEFSEAVPGVDGIGYTFIADTCWRCWWSLETWPGCSVTVHNSEIRGSCLRIPGSDTFDIYGITNYHFHPDLLVPLSDRHLEYINTYVFWWNWYPMENTVFNIDSCVFGEMIGRGNSITCATRCTHDGATITLNSSDSAFVSFVDGVSLGYVSSYKRSTLLLINTCVTPIWPYQSMNLAHGHSYFLAVNSYFEYEPEAMDTSLLMVAAIDSPSTGMIDTTIDIYGSAWIDAGPFNSITFDRCELYWTPEGDSIWTLMDESTSQVYNDVIGIWNTFGMSEGGYDLRLTIWDDVGDSLKAFRNISLQSLGIEEQDNPEGSYLFQNYPNPFREKTVISLESINHVDAAVTWSQHSIHIYDLTGRLVRTLVDEKREPGRYLVRWDGRDKDGKFMPSGIYFYKLKVGDESSRTRKMLFLN